MKQQEEEGERGRRKAEEERRREEILSWCIEKREILRVLKGKKRRKSQGKQ